MESCHSSMRAGSSLSMPFIAVEVGVRRNFAVRAQPLTNYQPMGFCPVETLKQDAWRFGVPFLNPCVNRSGVDCVPSGDSVLLGLRFVKDVGAASAKLIVEERERHGSYSGAADLVRRTGLKPQAVESLVMAGAFDSLVSNRRTGVVGRGAGYPPVEGTGSGPSPAP